MVYFFSLILAFCTGGYTHDFNISMVDLYVEDDQISVVFRFEKDDLYGCLFQNQVGTTVLPTDAQIQAYMDTHASLIINEKTTLELELASTTIEEDHIHLYFAKVELSSQIKTIRFFNSTLLKAFDDQIHIIQIHQPEKELRGFQMDKDRTTITVEL